MSTSVPTCCPLIRIFKRAKIQTEPFLPRSSRSQGDSAGRGGEGRAAWERERRKIRIYARAEIYPASVRVYLWKSRFPRLELLNEGRMWREGRRFCIHNYSSSPYSVQLRAYTNAKRSLARPLASLIRHCARSSMHAAVGATFVMGD